MTTAEIIRKRRKEKHITQQTLAELSGLSVMSIRRYESRNTTNRRTPNVEESKRIAAVLDLTWWELLGLDDYGNGVYAHEMEPAQAAKWEKRLGLTQSDEEELLQAFRALNADGKRECLKRVHELGELRQYKG